MILIHLEDFTDVTEDTDDHDDYKSYLATYLAPYALSLELFVTFRYKTATSPAKPVLNS